MNALRRAETPARPGPGPMPEPLLRALEISIGRRMEGLLAGDYRSSLFGEGTELAQVRPYVLGTDGFGRSETRQALRRHFEVDAECVALATMYQMSRKGHVPAAKVAEAVKVLGIDPEKLDPLTA